MADEAYSNIRDILGDLMGARVVDITQHDEDEFAADGRSYVMILFDNGRYVKFFVGDDKDGYEFEHNCGPGAEEQDEAA